MTTFDALMDIAEGRLRLQQVLAEYDLENIYNADETGLFYRMEPNRHWVPVA